MILFYRGEKDKKSEEWNKVENTEERNYILAPFLEDILHERIYSSSQSLGPAVRHLLGVLRGASVI